MKLKGKVVLITGGTRGIGRGIAIEAAKEGAILALNYRSNDQEAEKTSEDIKNMGGYCILLKGDISNYDTAQDIVKQTINTLGKVDILINNAGISKIGLLMDTDENQYDEIMNTNMKSVYNMTKGLINHMISRKEGSIINVSSMWGETGGACEVLYSASKGAVNAFTKALAKELAPSGIRVNAISPGVIDTEMNGWLSDEERQDLVEEIPMDRFGLVSEVGRAAAFLASDESSYITGHILKVDGGI